MKYTDKVQVVGEVLKNVTIFPIYIRCGCVVSTQTQPFGEPLTVTMVEEMMLVVQRITNTICLLV